MSSWTKAYSPRLGTALLAETRELDSSGLGTALLVVSRRLDSRGLQAIDSASWLKVTAAADSASWLKVMVTVDSEMRLGLHGAGTGRRL